MGKLSIAEWIREKITAISWNVFLWSINSTEEEYWNEIYEREERIIRANKTDSYGYNENGENYIPKCSEVKKEVNNEHNS